jgi:hypothetical protein
MRFLAALTAMAVVAARAVSDVTATPDTYDADANNDVTALEDGKNYVVKLDCLGCPFAVKQDNGRVSWPEEPHDNALVCTTISRPEDAKATQRLQVWVDTNDDDEPALFLNGRSILPLDPMPLNTDAFQVPANITEDDLLGFQSGSTFTRGVQIPLQYEHAVLPTDEAGQFWVQFDVTGLPLDMVNDPAVVDGGSRQPVKLDKEEQKLVQILVRQSNETQEMIIGLVETVLRKDRAQPLRMKCGALAIAQSKYDPQEWDEYGKLGSWSRYQNMVADIWDGTWDTSPLTLSMSLTLAFVILGIRAWYMYAKHAKASAQHDAEIALTADYEDAPPAYANIPVIKIEEYD